MNNGNLLDLEYPDHLSIDATLHFYSTISKISVEELYELKCLPDGITLHEKSSRKLVLFGCLGELLIQLFDYFPFARYQYLGCTQDSKSNLLSQADDILIIDGKSESLDTLIQNGVDKSKIIIPHFETESVVDRQPLMVFNRGGSDNDSKNCKNLIAIDQKVTGLMGFLNSVSGI